MMMSASAKIFLVLILFGAISCGTSPKELNFKVVEDIYKPVHSAEQIGEDLEFAYQRKETELTENIFEKWNKTVRPNTAEYIYQNDTISAIYEIFKTFYKPNDYLKFGNWGYRNYLKSHYKYIVVQNTILYSVLNSNKINKIEGINVRKSLITNFRPPISSDSNHVLYLTEEYAESLNNYLSAEIKKARDNQLNNTSGYRIEKLVKAELLRSYIPVNYDYLDRYWYFESNPYINKIIFNKTMNKAKIDFSVGQQGGEAILENKGQGWFVKQIKSNLDE